MQPINATEQLTAGRFNNSQQLTAAITAQDIDTLIDGYPHLTKTGKNMNGWFATHIRRIVTARFEELAKVAVRKGDRPDRYFSWLLKNERSI